ncbi:unnamed protein product [Dicrocoelium dendriticum]|nr:unnamed protein product [Dicrocoelium dendriticum]
MMDAKLKEDTGNNRNLCPRTQSFTESLSDNATDIHGTQEADQQNARKQGGKTGLCGKNDSAEDGLQSMTIRSKKIDILSSRKTGDKSACKKYQKICKIGEGAYGIVYKCRDSTIDRLVAIKQFTASEDDPDIRKMAMREIRMLKRLKHPNLVNLIEVFRKKKRLHLVFEYIDNTLLNELEQRPCRLDATKIKKITWQLLLAIEFCHHSNCIHRDIKPENILISNTDEVKLCDFGFARFTTGSGGDYTDYVATRWYRAPELLVGDTQYGTPVDVWAIGCVFAELISSKPLWPGSSDLDQLYLITRNMGNLINRHRKIFAESRYFDGIQLPTVTNMVSLDKRFEKDPRGLFGPTETDFMLCCLRMNPEERWTCSELLKHPYFSNIEEISEHALLPVVTQDTLNPSHALHASYEQHHANVPVEERRDQLQIAEVSRSEKKPTQIQQASSFAFPLRASFNPRMKLGAFHTNYANVFASPDPRHPHAAGTHDVQGNARNISQIQPKQTQRLDNSYGLIIRPVHLSSTQTAVTSLDETNINKSQPTPSKTLLQIPMTSIGCVRDASLNLTRIRKCTIHRSPARSTTSQPEDESISVP